MVFDNTPIINGTMVVDRGSPMGNSPGSDNRGRLHVFVANTSSEPLPVTFTTEALDPEIVNFPVAAANTEESYTFPDGTKKWSMYCRNDSVMKIAWESGESGTVFKTIYPGNEYGEDVDVGGKTVYFQTSKAGEVVEISLWTAA